MENLPEEIIAEIFLRLPTKSLARLRCVSSSWNSLLSDPSFIRIHLHRSSLPRNRRLLLKYTDRLISKLVILPPALDDFSDLNPPPRSSDLVKFEVVGACNGVICLTVFREQNPRRAEILLWNPSTNHLFTLPCSHSPISASISFGFNPSSGHLNDFKVLKIKFEEGGIRSRVQIYSLVTDSWKQIGDSFPSWCRWFGTDHHQVILNRFICWCPPLGYDFEEISSSLKLFDVASEEFREIELPESIYSYHKNIALLDDCLCVVASLRRNLQKIKVFEVWKMEELGIEVGSWSKVYKFELSTVMFPLYKPLGLGHGGCCVLFAHNKSVDFGPKTDSFFAVYDTVEDKFGRVFDLSFDSVSSSRLYEYTESLISPLPGNK